MELDNLDWVSKLTQEIKSFILCGQPTWSIVMSKYIPGLTETYGQDLDRPRMLNKTEGKEIVMQHVSKAVHHWLGFPSSLCKSEVQAFFTASVQ
jgi:hypothetical protein